MEEEKLIEGLTADTSPTAETAVPPLHEERAREENTDMPPAEISADGNFFAPTSRASVPSSTASGPPLAAARSPRGSEMPPAFHSTPLGRCATPSGEGLETPSTASELRPTASNPERDWSAEWAELAREHPEVIGKTLPNDIYEVCINSDRPPLRVYESMMLEKLNAEVSRLQKENETLRQNAANSMRAPVTGVAGGGVRNEAEDEFLRGFNNFLNV